ncbi:MAG: hypothetical protein AAF773_25900, partial [Cyanobacteria bacterium P01_D01_bin.115]
KYFVDNQRIDSLVSDRLTDRRWRGVFLLVAGLLSGQQGADSLLLAMERQAQTWITPKTLQTLLTWTDATARTLPETVNVAASRTVALVLVLTLALVLEADTNGSSRALSLAIEQTQTLIKALGCQTNPSYVQNLDLILARTGVLTWSRTLTQVDVSDRASNQFLALSTALSLTQDLVQTFHTLRILDAPQMATLVQQLTALNKPNGTPNSTSDEPRNRALKFWLDAVHLPTDLLPLSELDIVGLSNYLYAMELIVRCKEAAVRVSPQVWQGIQARILAVGD